MSTSKHFDKIVAVVLVLGLLLTVAFINGEALGIDKIIDEDAEQYEESEYFTANDLNGDWDASNPTATITLNGDSAKVSGNGAYYNDGSVVITGAGYYVFSGTLDNGRIVVDVEKAYISRLLTVAGFGSTILNRGLVSGTSEGSVFGASHTGSSTLVNEGTIDVTTMGVVPLEQIGVLSTFASRTGAYGLSATGADYLMEKLHEKFGFNYCGGLVEVGHKHGKYIGVMYYQLMV